MSVIQDMLAGKLKATRIYGSGVKATTLKPKPHYKKCLIYCLGLTGSHINKIGYSRDKITLKKRVSQLQQGNPETLKVKWVMPSITDDLVIHKQLESVGIKRTRGKGEWFYIGADRLKAFLKRIRPVSAQFFQYP